VPIMEQEIRKERIVIEDDVWIGAGAKVLGGVTVHRGAVVGAGAVVTSDVPENCVVAGVPARPIKMRGERGPGAAP
jgi:maltose O-acetyltransferase